MAPITSKPDLAAEELRLELEALNQALQYRSHTRCKSHSTLVRHASPKHPLQPKPSFKVPFRSASVISCDCPKGPASSSSTKPLHHQHHEKKGTHHEKKATLHEKKGHHQHQHHERKSFWRWKPLRAISHLIMSSHRRLHVLFSLHVHRIEGLPVPMNGLRLTVRWICKDHGLQTIPSRIFHGIAEFGETLRHRCTVYGTCCPNNMIRYDAKPSTLSIVALDVDELELAKHHVDLSSFLLQNDVIGNAWQENSHSTSYELSGIAKGSTLIVSFSYDLAHHDTGRGNDGMHPTTKQLKKTSAVTKSLPLSKQGLPISTSPSLSEPSADAALCHDIEQLDLIEGHALQAYCAEHKASNLSDSGFSSSFEFKPNLDCFLEDEHEEEFSFLQADEVRSASFKNFESSLNEEEGLLMSFSFSNTVNICDSSNLRGDKECKIGTQMQLDQWKPQETWDSGQEGSTIGQWAYEESKFMKVLQTESDDELDLIAEEFLNMLGVGLNAGPCNNSEGDPESAGEGFLKQSELDNLFESSYISEKGE